MPNDSGALSNLNLSPTKGQQQVEDDLIELKTAPAPEKKEGHGKSTLSQADKEKEIQEHILDVNIPTLPIPFVNIAEYTNFQPNLTSIDSVSAGSFAIAYQNRLSEICIDMLDKWNESIKKIAEQSEKDRNSPARLSFEDYISHIKRGDPAEMTRLAATTGAFIVGAGIVGDLITGVNSVTNVDHVAGITAVDASNQVGMIGNIQEAIVQLTPVDMQAELGLIGSFYATSALYQATWISIAESANENKVNNANLAKNYANEVLKQVNLEGFNQFVMTMVIGKIKGSDGISDERSLELVAIVKLVLLTSAMAALTKAETGHLIADDIGKMILAYLQGKEINYPSGDSRWAILAELKVQLGYLSPGEKDRVLNGLLSYINRDPKVEELTNPASVFQGIFQTVAADMKA